MAAAAVNGLEEGRSNTVCLCSQELVTGLLSIRTSLILFLIHSSGSPGTFSNRFFPSSAELWMRL